ncbi:MAG: uroporphyrinogen-III C-methyltransferase [Luteimonas sp.]
MNVPTAQPARRRGNAFVGWIVLILLVVGFWRGWLWWQAWRSHEANTAAGTTQQIDALQARVDALRNDQRAQAQRVQQADATNRVLRDELLGIGQRAALLEDSVAKLADPERHGSQALRLDEVELLLNQGQQRLLLAGDLDGARRAYALASGLLDGVEDPAYLNLRQALVQERAMLDALGADPKIVALGRLEAYTASLPTLSSDATTAPNEQPDWWHRAFARVIDVRPSNQSIAVAPGDRAAGWAALQLEFALARAAIERRDRNGYRAALTRADAWLLRLWPDTPTRRQHRTQLRALRDLPLTVALPTLGTTLTQLRALRAAR